MSPLLWLLIWLAFLPCAAASGATTPFPDIPFAAFSDFVLTTFNPDISLATVLLVLFSLVENPDLLNLHARQKHPNQQNENRIVASGWLKSLSRALGNRLGVETGLLMLFKENQMLSDSWDTDLTMKLDGFSELLGLTPYKQGVFSRKLRKHSIRVVASSSNTTFETIPNIAIDDLTQHAFAVLGKDTEPIAGTKPVNMLTLDGVVMGPQICAFEDCTNDLVNARGGALCAIHEVLLGSKCRMAGCQRNKVGETQACNEHLDIWRKSVQDRSKATINGIRRILQRPGERQEWQQLPETAIQRPHDEEDPEAARFPRRKNYFSPNRSYCVETACAPCGVVLAWTKFAKSESPTNILNWLKDLFPTKDDRPSYVCIDKACQVFKTARMTSQNFNWFIHTMLIYHVKHVLSKASSIPDENSSDDESSEDEESSSSSSSDDTSDDDESESGDTDSSDKDMDVDM
ncbi:hypothetical protein FPV67DRAFT_1429731 [Lyophyllum atratum]|nr:hypothetical protein FPV67DRAFT_1429731 [Lyophyllum atratum]